MNFFANHKLKYVKLEQIAAKPDPVLLKPLLEDTYIDINYIYEDRRVSPHEETSDMNIFQLFCARYIFNLHLDPACKSAYEKCIDLILDRKIDIRYRDSKWKFQALDFAALTGNEKILKRTLEEYEKRDILYVNSSVLVNLLDFIYEQETKVEDVDEKKKTWLAEREETFNILLDKGVDVNLITDDGEVTVYAAFYLQNVNFLNKLLDKCKTRIDFHSKRNPIGRTMEEFLKLKNTIINTRELFISLNENSRIEFEKTYMDYQVTKSLSQEEFWSLILCSVEYGKVDIFVFLFAEYKIKYPCQSKQEEKQCNILIEKCCLIGDDVILPKILSQVSEIQIYNHIIWDLVITSDSRITDKASNERYCNCLAILLDYNKETNFDINQVDCYGNTLLHYSVKNKYGEMTLELLKHGASLVAQNNDSLVLQMNKTDVEEYLDSCVGYQYTQKKHINNSKTKDKKQKSEKGVLSVDLTALLPPRQVDIKVKTSQVEYSQVENAEVDIHVDTNKVVVPIETGAEGEIKKQEKIRESEMTILEQLCNDSEYRTLLVHPVIVLFCYLKWHRIRMFFFMDLLIYFLFLSSHVVLVLTKMLLSDDSSGDDMLSVIENMGCDEKKDSVKATYYILLTTFIGFLVWEFIQFLIFRFEYFKTLENYMKLALMAITVGILVLEYKEHDDKPEKPESRTTTMVEVVNETAKVITTTTIIMLSNKVNETCVEWTYESWEVQLFAVDAVISIVNLFFLTAYIPRFSNNVVMIKTVYRNLFKFFLTYSILIFAFAASFYVLFRDSSDLKGFSNPAIALFKTLIMMTGEYDSSDLMGNNTESSTEKGMNNHPETSYAIFTVFIILMSIGMLNLLTGLAVSDIQTLKHDAKMLYLEMRINQVIKMEKLLVNSFMCFNFVSLFFKNDENKQVIIYPLTKVAKVKDSNSMTVSGNLLRNLKNCQQKSRIDNFNKV